VGRQPAQGQGDRSLLGNLAGAVPLLALDMYEHSYHMDFGARAGAYVDAFMNNLNLAAASRKLAAAAGA
jgi:Fe-Mn family superoxide dismutase